MDWEALRDKVRRDKEDVAERLTSLPGVQEVRFASGDYLTIVFEDGSVLDLFPADYGGVQGVIVNKPGESQVSYRGW